MNLFLKEKSIANKILNLILVIWLVGVLFYFGNALVNLIMPEYEYKDQETYNKYYCFISEEDDCDKKYKMEIEKQSYERKKTFLYSSLQVIIIFTAMILVNREKEQRKKVEDEIIQF